MIGPEAVMVRWVLVAAGCSGGGPSGDGSGGDDDDNGVSTEIYTEIRPNFAFTDEEFEGGRVTWVMPENPRAVAFVFHGSSGNIAAVQQTEWIELYDLLVPEGVGLVLSQSVDRENGQWDT